MSVEHLPRRPSWDCRACDREWPCAEAKADLVEEHKQDPTSGTFYLAICMREAIDDSFLHHGPEPVAMWERFLGWYVALRLRPRRVSSNAR